MNQIAIGQRMPMRQIDINTNEPVTLKVTRQSHSKAALDVSCFALDVNGKLINDDYIVFHKQPASPCGQVQFTHHNNDTSCDDIQAEFKVSLSQLPYSVDSLFFVLSGGSPLNSIDAVDVSIWQTQQKAFAKYQSADFTRQKTSMLMQLYRKGGIWRLSNICKGFNGGFGGVAQHLGAKTAAFNQADNNQPKHPQKITSDASPHMADLLERSAASLVKKGLKQSTTKMVLALEASHSMEGQYIAGHIQEIVDRFTALAVNLDTTQSFDCWAFSGNTVSLGAVTPQNHKGFVGKPIHNTARSQPWSVGTRGSNEVKIMQTLADSYADNPTGEPTYILMVSDGSVSRNAGIAQILKENEHLPIFWQILGLDGFNYGNLKKLGLSGTGVKNCGFFEIESLESMSKDRLYDAMLHEYSVWLKTAVREGLVDI